MEDNNVSVYNVVEFRSTPQHQTTITVAMHFLAFISLFTLAAAAPTELAERAAATCGNTFYSANAVNAASQAACNFVKAGTKAGSSNYPHQYNNYEGFQFQGLSAPFYEFPILSSGSIYSGGELKVQSY